MHTNNCTHKQTWRIMRRWLSRICRGCNGTPDCFSNLHSHFVRTQHRPLISRRTHARVCACVCLRVCVRERERERWRRIDRESSCCVGGCAVEVPLESSSPHSRRTRRALSTSCPTNTFAIPLIVKIIGGLSCMFFFFWGGGRDSIVKRDRD